MSINDVTHLGGRGICQKVTLLHKQMGDKGEGAVKNLQKWVTSFMDSPKYSSQLCSTILKYNVHIASPPHSTKLVRRLYMLEVWD